MTYIVLEMQTNGGTTAIVPPLAYTDRNAAEQKFHQVMAVAAVSSVETHTGMILTEDGRVIRQERYVHPLPEPEPEPEEPGEEIVEPE